MRGLKQIQWTVAQTGTVGECLSGRIPAHSKTEDSTHRGRGDGDDRRGQVRGMHTKGAHGKGVVHHTFVNNTRAAAGGQWSVVTRAPTRGYVCHVPHLEGVECRAGLRAGGTFKSVQISSN